VLDFLSSTDVGRRVPAEEEDAVSEVSEAELREWMEEQVAGAEEPDGGTTAVPTHARLHGIRGNGIGGGLNCAIFLCLFLLSSTLALRSFLL